MGKAASVFLQPDIQPRDLQKLIRWLSNENVIHYLNESDRVLAELQLLQSSVPQYLWEYRFNQNGRFMMIVTEECGTIGFIKYVARAAGEFELVFVVGEESLWGNGYGVSAVERAISHLFLERRAEAVVAKIYHGNERSKRTVFRCGFHKINDGQELSTYRIDQREYLEWLKQGGLRHQKDQFRRAYGG